LFVAAVLCLAGGILAAGFLPEQARWIAWVLIILGVALVVGGVLDIARPHRQSPDHTEDDPAEKE